MPEPEPEPPKFHPDVVALDLASKDDWLAARGAGVGASEIASLFAPEIAKCREDDPEEPLPFVSAFELYARKVGAIESPPEETQRMRLGTRFEAGIADEFAEMTKLKVIRTGPAPFTLFRNSALPSLFATPDRFVLLPAGWGVLEVKLVGRKWKKIPLRTLLQVQGQLAVVKMQEGRVAACVASDVVLPFEAAYDSELIGMIVERVTTFWKRVEAREPPEPTAADREVVRKLWPRPEMGKTVALSEVYDGVLDAYERSKTLSKLHGDIADQQAACLTNAMKDAETATLPSGRKVSWKLVQRPAYSVSAGEARILRVLSNKED